ADEVEAEAGIATDGPGGVARQDVDLAGLQRRKALLGSERRIADLGRIAEYRGRDGAAHVDVDATPHAFGVGLREAGKSAVDAALHVALRAHGIEGRLRPGRRGQKYEEQPELSQVPPPSSRK